MPSPTKKPPKQAPRGGNHVRLDLTDDHRDRLRVLAARAGMSMASYARAVVVREVEKCEP